VTGRSEGSCPASYRWVWWYKPMSYWWCAACDRVVYEPATIHDEMSAWLTAPRAVQLPSVPTGAPTRTYATLRDSTSVENNSWGESKEPVVSRFTWPLNDESLNRLVATWADDPTAFPSTWTGIKLLPDP